MILAWLSIAFLCGVWAGLGENVLPPLVALVSGVVVMGFGAAVHGRTRTLLLILGALSLGLARSPHAAHGYSPDEVGYYNGRDVLVQGAVSAEPDVRDTGANYVVSASSVSLGGRGVPVSGAIRVHTSRAVQLDFGDRVELRGHLASGGTVSSSSSAQASMLFPRVLVRAQETGGWRGWLIHARQFLESAMNAWLPEPEAALLIAIVLGAHTASLGDLVPILVSTGLIHVVAISGIKVALVAGTVHQFARRTGRRGMTLGVALVTLLAYVLLTGATASGERSALMWALVFLAVYLGRATVALVSLGCVAALMVALDPTLLTDTAFLMSTAGTLGIVAFAGPLGRRLRLVPSPWRDVLCVSAAAQAATLPIVIFGFHVVSVMSPVANAIVLPFLPALIALGFLLGAVGGLSPVAAPVAAFADVLLRVFITVARDLARLPAVVQLSSLATAWSALYYGLLGLAALWLLRREGWVPIREWTGHGREFAVAAMCGACVLTGWTARPGSGGGPNLQWLGSGEALLVQDRGKVMLIDGSPQPYVLLERLGQELPFATRIINVVAVTDARAASLSGLQEVLRHYRVQEVLDVGLQYPSTTYAAWRETLRARRVPDYALRTGASVRLPDGAVTALGPDGPCGNPRDCAGILRVVLGAQSYLLVGAASVREEHEAVFRGVNLRAETVIASTDGPIDAALLDAVHPRIVASAAPVGPATVRLRTAANLYTDPGSR